MGFIRVSCFVQSIPTFFVGLCPLQIFSLLFSPLLATFFFWLPRRGNIVLSLLTTTKVMKDPLFD